MGEGREMEGTISGQVVVVVTTSSRLQLATSADAVVSRQAGVGHQCDEAAALHHHDLEPQSGVTTEPAVPVIKSEEINQMPMTIEMEKLIKKLAAVPTPGALPLAVGRTNRCDLCNGAGELTTALRTSTFSEKCWNASNDRGANGPCSFCSGETGTHEVTEVDEEGSVECPRCAGTGEEAGGVFR